MTLLEERGRQSTLYFVTMRIHECAILSLIGLIYVTWVHAYSEGLNILSSSSFLTSSPHVRYLIGYIHHLGHMLNSRSWTLSNET